MTEFLTYDLKVALLIAVFYMFYRLMLARETFHHVNRIVLLLTAAASYILPLCVITFHETVVMSASPQITIGELQASVSEPSEPWWQTALILLFFIGAAAALGHTLCSLFRIISLINHSEQHPQADGTILCVTGNADLAPFSWMHFIVMNRSDYETNDAAILAHERGHIRLHHSWDVLLVDLLTALQWFNPAMWMLRADLRAIHEFEADAAVLSQGINARQYQYLLITKAGGIGGYSLVNGITHSALKKRITMMSNKKSQRNRLLKLFALIPIVGIALGLNARTVTDYVYDEPQKQQPVKKGKKATTIKVGNQKVDVVKAEQTEQTKPDQPAEKTTPTTITPENVFEVVEQMPEFPGGIQALMQFLAQNIKYPKEAMQADKQGRVLVSFVVGIDGSISEATVVKSVDPQLDAEALRVINAMPNWTPGMQKGEPVRVKYTIPIHFRLDEKSAKPAESNEQNANVIMDGKTLQNVMLIVDDKVMDISKLNTISPDKISKMEILKDRKELDYHNVPANYDGLINITTKK